MAAKKVHVTLTLAEANALERLADCAGCEWQDAMDVLRNGSAVAAGYRAIRKLTQARMKAEQPVYRVKLHDGEGVEV